jgi:hypothetical protein
MRIVVQGIPIAITNQRRRSLYTHNSVFAQKFQCNVKTLRSMFIIFYEMFEVLYLMLFYSLQLRIKNKK